MLVECLTERALLCLGQSNVMGSILENANLNFSITMATALMHQNMEKHDRWVTINLMPEGMLSVNVYPWSSKEEEEEAEE